MKLNYTDFETGFNRDMEADSVSFAFLDKDKTNGQDIVVLRINGEEKNLIEVTAFTIHP